MNDLRTLRAMSGVNQFRVAVKTGVARVRLSLAENSELALTADEDMRVRKFLLGVISERAVQFERVLSQAGCAEIRV